jgi:hypothetical protein
MIDNKKYLSTVIVVFKSVLTLRLTLIIQPFLEGGGGPYQQK